MQYTPGRTAGLLREFDLSPLCLGHWQRNRSDCWVLRVSDCKAFVAVISGITDRTTVYRDGTNTYDSTISTLPGFVGPVDNAYVSLLPPPDCPISHVAILIAFAGMQPVSPV